MKNAEVTLGTDFEEKHRGIGEIASSTVLSEKVSELTCRVDELTRAFNEMHTSIIKKCHKPSNIPPGTLLFGKSANKKAILVVTDDGLFIGQTKYNSLSAAAKEISGVRRSGWVFWKTADGQTAKEKFMDKKRNAQET